MVELILVVTLLPLSLLLFVGCLIFGLLTSFSGSKRVFYFCIISSSVGLLSSVIFELLLYHGLGPFFIMMIAESTIFFAFIAFFSMSLGTFIRHLATSLRAKDKELSSSPIHTNLNIIPQTKEQSLVWQNKLNNSLKSLKINRKIILIFVVLIILIPFALYLSTNKFFKKPNTINTLPAFDKNICSTQNNKYILGWGKKTPQRMQFYDLNTDTCGGYRCSANNYISPSCYNEEECKSLCKNDCINIQETKNLCSQVLPSPSPTINSTANWKTYTNGDYTFKYPADKLPIFSENKNSMSIGLSNNNRGFMPLDTSWWQISIAIIDSNTQSSNIGQYVDQYIKNGFPQKTTRESLTISGEAAEKLIGYRHTDISIDDWEIFVQHNKIIYKINIGPYINDSKVGKERQELTNQILQTFRFSEPVEQKAMDDERKYHIGVIQRGLELFKSDKGKYPNILEELVTTGYLKLIPLDPETNNAYIYQTANNGFSYILSATLSDGSQYQKNNP